MQKSILENPAAAARSLLTTTAIAVIWAFSGPSGAASVGECLGSTGYAIWGSPASGVSIGASSDEMFGPAATISCTHLARDSTLAAIQGQGDANLTSGVGAQTGTGALAFPGAGPNIDAFIDIIQYFRFRIDAPGLAPLAPTDITVIVQIDYGIIVQESGNGGTAGNRLDIQFGARLAADSVNFPVAFEHFDTAPTENGTVQLLDTLTVNANADLDFAIRVLANSFARGISGCCGAPAGDGAASMLALVTFFIVPEEGATVAYDYESALNLPGPILGQLVTTVPVPAGLWLLVSGILVVIRYPRQR